MTEAPDTVYLRPNYLSSYVGVRIKADEPNPRLWYHCRLLKKGGYIRLDVNRASVQGKTLGYVPIFAWEDTRGVLGPALNGPGLRIEQQGAGRWRGLHIWRHGDASHTRPDAPAGFAAKKIGARRVQLTWRDGPQNRSEFLYDLHRAEAADFEPNDGNRIVADLTGCRYEDIGLGIGGLQPGGTYHYKLRARNVLGLASGFAQARAATGLQGAAFIFLEAEQCGAIEKPFVVGRGASWGETFIWAPGVQDLKYDPARPGAARFEFTIEDAGDYHIWGRVMARDTSSDSFWVVSPAGEPVSFGVGLCRRWEWALVHRLRPVALSAGKRWCSGRGKATRSSTKSWSPTISHGGLSKRSMSGRWRTPNASISTSCGSTASSRPLTGRCARGEPDRRRWSPQGCRQGRRWGRIIHEEDGDLLGRRTVSRSSARASQ